MLKEKTAIGPGLLFSFTFSVIYGYGMLLSPVIAVKYIGNNGFWGILLAFVLFLPVVYAAFKLTERFSGKSLIEYLPEIFGKYIGKVVGVLYLLLILVIMTLALRITVEVLNIYFLFRTPAVVISAIILLTIAYTTYHGIEVITRLASFIFGPALLFIVIGIALSFVNFQFQTIRPLFLINYEKLAVGTMHLTNIFFPGIILFSVLQYLTNTKKGIKNVYKATSLAGFLIFLVVMTNIGVLSPKGVTRYSFPFFEMTRITTIPFILQTYGVFYSVVWFTQIFISISGFYFTVSQGFVELTGLLNYKRFILLLFPVILILSNYPPSIIEVREIYDAIRPMGFILLIVGPIAIWLISLFKKRRAAGDVH